MNQTETKIGNAILKVSDWEVQLLSTDGYAICSINKERKSVYFCPYGRYDSDQVAKLDAPHSDTYNIIDNPDKKPSQNTRLEKVEQKLKELQDEINCIRNND